MEKHKLTLNNIYHVDETGPEKDPRRVGGISSGKRRSNIIVMCAMSATENFTALLVIFPVQRMPQLLETVGPPGAICVLTLKIVAG